MTAASNPFTYDCRPMLGITRGERRSKVQSAGLYRLASRKYPEKEFRSEREKLLEAYLASLKRDRVKFARGRTGAYPFAAPASNSIHHPGTKTKVDREVRRDRAWNGRVVRVRKSRTFQRKFRDTKRPPRT